jgi:hypothetical protein
VARLPASSSLPRPPVNRRPRPVVSRSPTGAHLAKSKQRLTTRRYRPGTVALREIRRYQKSTELLIRKLPCVSFNHGRRRLMPCSVSNASSVRSPKTSRPTCASSLPPSWPSRSPPRHTSSRSSRTPTCKPQAHLCSPSLNRLQGCHPRQACHHPAQGPAAGPPAPWRALIETPPSFRSSCTTPCHVNLSGLLPLPFEALRSLPALLHCREAKCSSATARLGSRCETLGADESWARQGGRRGGNGE